MVSKFNSTVISSFNVKPEDCKKALDFAIKNWYRLLPLIDTENEYLWNS